MNYNDFTKFKIHETIEDNTFAYARLWFKNMDKLIDVMNKFSGKLKN